MNEKDLSYKQVTEALGKLGVAIYAKDVNEALEQVFVLKMLLEHINRLA